MSFSKSVLAPRRVLALLAIAALACASSGGTENKADSPDADTLDCSALTACGGDLGCPGDSKCFKLKACPEFVCASLQQACRAECGAGVDCLLLESQPLLLSLIHI